MKSFLILLVSTLIGTTIAHAQIKHAKTETVKVYGNCGMCETTIEKAAGKKNISKADWNEETNMATITYDSSKTSLDAVLKNIALAGYDNQNFLAPDAVYDKLHHCCRYERVAKTAMLPPAANSMMATMDHQNHGHHNATVTPQDQSNELTAVMAGYFSLKDALVSTDGNLAAASAKELQVAISGVDMQKLPNDVHMVWMKELNDLNKGVSKIAETKTIAQQRDHFMELSKSMYAVMKVTKLAEPVYYQFCPMANGGKGANWLSKESNIKNPYYGAMMLTCGSIVETIN